MTLITTSEAAAFLKVSKVAVHKMIQNGRLTVVATRPHPGGHQRLLHKTEVEQLKKTRRKK